MSALCDSRLLRLLLVVIRSLVSLDMLQPILNTLNSQRIILASSSERRKQIFANIGLKVEILPSSCEENLNKNDFATPYGYAMATAALKGNDVASCTRNHAVVPNLIISADTVVSCDGVIFEKPKDEEDAFQMLSKLSGKTHTVYTGVVLIQPQTTDVREFYEATDVVFPLLPPEVIRAYVDTKEPLDKAGAYGIQGIGGSLVEAIHGDYFNVMGFPLHRFCKELLRMYKTS